MALNNSNNLNNNTSKPNANAKQGNLLVRIDQDSAENLQALFDSVLGPTGTTRKLTKPFRMRDLPPSFFNPPLTGSKSPSVSHSRENSADSAFGSGTTTICSPSGVNPTVNRLPISHSRAHSSPASLQQTYAGLNNNSSNINSSATTQQQQGQTQSTTQTIQPVHMKQRSYDVVSAIQLQDELGELPAGWEQARTAEGQIYYLNHITRTTQWEDPRKQVAAQQSLTQHQSTDSLLARTQQQLQQQQQQQQQQQAPLVQQKPPNAPTGSTAREKIWSGVLEWIEKAKAADQPKVTRQVPCNVTANIKDGELEIKADNWPSRLIMQLMPKQLVGNIGGQFLKDSKTVVFHPNACEALEALSKVMSSGFAGCVHFTMSPANNVACDIKVLILLYTPEKKAFLGFVPNNQVGFVDRLRKVIQQKQGIRQNPQGQLTGQPTQPIPPGAPGSSNNQIKLEPGTQSDPFKSFDGYGQMPVQQMQDNMSNNMQMAAQQQDFKMAENHNQRYAANAMMQQQQQQQQAQQQQQQQRANLNNPQQANQLLNAQRMMRPVLPSNNPGLRHLLQQQPPQSPNSQYRPVMGMQNQQGMGPHMGVRPQNPNAPYDESSFDFM